MLPFFLSPFLSLSFLTVYHLPIKRNARKHSSRKCQQIICNKSQHVTDAKYIQGDIQGDKKNKLILTENIALSVKRSLKTRTNITFPLP